MIFYILLVIVIPGLIFLYYIQAGKTVSAALISLAAFIVELIVSYYANIIFPGILPPIPTSGSTTTAVSAEVTTKTDYIIPDSDQRLITEDDLINFTPWELRIARNEIYARRGREFQIKEIREYFKEKSWYTVRYTADYFTEHEDELLNSKELANIEVIVKYEEKMGYNQD